MLRQSTCMQARSSILAIAVAIAGAVVVANDTSRNDTPKAVQVAIEQVHLALTGRADAVAVDFAANTTNPCEVQAWNESLRNASFAMSTATAAIPDGQLHTHTALLTGLKARAIYNYSITCGTSSRAFNLTSQPEREEGLKFAFFADFGLDNDVSMARLVQSRLNDEVDLYLHGGDFAYDLWTNHSQVGNEFMRQVEGFAAYKPYMPAPGNHERADNFTQYVNRFSGVRLHGPTGNNFFYSWDSNLVHFVAIDTEIFRYGNETAGSPTPITIEEQFKWLDDDLARANDNRDKTPWIVMFGHKGWHMDFEFNKHLEPLVKTVTNFTGFSELADKYKVDLYLTGHLHIYQRFLPLLGPSKHEPFAKPRAVDRTCESDDNGVYTNPAYMTTIVAGSPGDDERTIKGLCLGEDFNSPQTINTTAVCHDDYGFGIATVPNATHLHWQWIRTGRGNLPKTLQLEYEDANSLEPKVVDDLWIVKTASP